MMEFVKKNVVTLLIVAATIVLAGIAIFTAVRLYQLRQESVSPAAPESRPAAQTTPTVVSCQTLTFTIGEEEEVIPGCYESCTLGGSDCPTGLDCQTINGSDVCVNTECSEDSDCSCDEVVEVTYSCNSICTDDSNCQEVSSDYVCYDTGTEKRCRLSANTSSTTCAEVGVTLTPTATPTPVSQAPELPEAGIGTPTIIGAGMGILLIIGAVLLAL